MAIVKIKDILTRMKELSSKSAVAGWVDGNGSGSAAFCDMLVRKYTGESTPSITEDPSDALIARTLNYGRQAGVTASGREYKEIPARPFMTVAWDRFLPRQKVLVRRFMPKVLRGEMSVDDFYKNIGEQLMSCIQDAMRDSDKYQGLSEATKAARRRRANDSPKPLIDTARLIGNLTFEIRGG